MGIMISYWQQTNNNIIRTINTVVWVYNYNTVEKYKKLDSYTFVYAYSRDIHTIIELYHVRRANIFRYTFSEISIFSATYFPQGFTTGQALVTRFIH